MSHSNGQVGGVTGDLGGVDGIPSDNTSRETETSLLPSDGLPTVCETQEAQEESM